MDVRDGAVLGVAGLLAGAVNGVAGGGTLISFPAMLALGYSPVAANVSSSLATLPGYVGGLLGYRRELRSQVQTAMALAPASVIGACVGASALLILPSKHFSTMAPFLVLAAVAALGFQSFCFQGPARKEHVDRPAALRAVQFVVAIYGGYFAAGLGVLLLATLRIFRAEGVHELNALKGALSLLIGLVSAVCFIVFGPIAWAPVAILSVAGLAGGRLGVGLARHLPALLLQRLIVAMGLALSVALFLK